MFNAAVVPCVASCDRILRPAMKSTDERSTIQDLKEEPAPHTDAGFRHCEAGLCGPWRRQVFGGMSMYLSR